VGVDGFDRVGVGDFDRFGVDGLESKENDTDFAVKSYFRVALLKSTASESELQSPF
jgi:hypothetical protein